MDKPSFDEIATAGNGRDITRGYLTDNVILPNEDSVLSQRSGGDFKIYDDIARDDQVKACRQQREHALIATEWGIEPGDSSRAAQKAADRLADTLSRLEWDDKTRKMLGAIFYGYSVAEVLWSSDGREIGIADLKVRNRSRFGFLPSGELRMLTAANLTDGEALPPAKFWAFACGSDPEKKRLLQALASIQSSTAIRIPEGMQIELLEATRTGIADYPSLYDRMNATISKVYLGHNASTESTPGKLGGKTPATRIRQDLVKADADLICGSFNRTVARWLTWYNDGPDVAPPKLWRKTEQPDDLKAAVETDKKLFDMGFKPTLKYITDRYGPGYVIRQDAPPSPPANFASRPLVEGVDYLDFG